MSKHTTLYQLKMLALRTKGRDQQGRYPCDGAVWQGR